MQKAYIYIFILQFFLLLWKKNYICHTVKTFITKSCKRQITPCLNEKIIGKMNTDPHNLMNPLREKFPYFIRHEKLYRMIHLQLMKNGFNTLYCSSSLAPFAPLYMAHSRNPLLTTTIYIHSTILLPLFSPLNTDYESQRLQYNMPVANTHGRHAYAISSLFMES